MLILINVTSVDFFQYLVGLRVFGYIYSFIVSTSQKKFKLCLPKCCSVMQFNVCTVVTKLNKWLRLIISESTVINNRTWKREKKSFTTPAQHQARQRRHCTALRNQPRPFSFLLPGYFTEIKWFIYAVKVILGISI